MVNVDQRGFVNQPSTDPEWLSGAEAAAFLGVKRETLYAYVSRGEVRSEPGAGGRGKRYRREDLARLKARSDARAGHGPVAAGALRWGEPVLSSALTGIDAGGPRYRGMRAVDLAESATFEAVAELLWSGALPADRPAFAAEGLGIKTAPIAALLPAGAHPLTTLSIAVPAIGAGDPGRFNAAPEADRLRARGLIRRMAALIGFAITGAPAAKAALAAPSIAAAALVSLGVKPTAKAERAVDRALILMADHELNASSFAVRVAASAGADLYASMSAGLATLSGPRHGGVCDRVEALIAEAGRADRARAVIEGRSRRGEEVPGFGHPLYPEGDPRAAALLATARALAPHRAAAATIEAIIEAMRDLGREPPSSDVGLTAVAEAIGLPPGSAAALFALGRAAGWVAHAFEQREEGSLLRPRARYVGP